MLELVADWPSSSRPMQRVGIRLLAAPPRCARPALVVGILLCLCAVPRAQAQTSPPSSQIPDRPAQPADAAKAETPPSPAEVQSPATAAPPDLDQLLRLPPHLTEGYKSEVRTGASRRAWRERFRTHREELHHAKRALEKSRSQLAEIAAKSGAWNLGAPGTGGAQVDPDTPLSFELKLRIRREEEELRHAEHALRELEIEANLAAIPEDWRRAFEEPDDGEGRP